MFLFLQITMGDLALPALFVGANNLLLYLASRRRVETVKVGVVSKLLIYPVKSVPGVSVESCITGYKGLYRDNLIDRYHTDTLPFPLFILSS